MLSSKKLLLTAALMAAATPALAQQQGATGQQGMPQGMQQQQMDISGEKLEQYAEARADVEQITEKWNERMADMEPQERQGAAQKINNNLVEAVEGAGLEVVEYNSISRAVQADPQLAQQVQSMMR